MNHTLLLASLGAILALDHIMIGQFMLCQPLVIGAIFGGLLGDVNTGLLMGSMVQLIWLSIIPVGAYIPSDYTVTGGVGACLAIMLTHQLKFPPAPSLILALALAIPAGSLAGRLDIWIRRVCNDRLARKAEALANQGQVPPLGWIQFLALVPSFAKAWIIYVFWLGPVGLAAAVLYKHLPAVLVRGLELAFWVLPALAFGAVFELAARDRLQWWFLGALGLLWPLLLVWPEQRWLALGLALVIGAGLAWGWKKR